MRMLRSAAIVAMTSLAMVTGAYAQMGKIEKPNLTLAVGSKTLVAYLPLTIADSLGFFKKEGLNVTIDNFAGGSKALQALVGGSADVVCGAYEHTIYMAAKGEHITTLALQNNSFGLVIALRKDKVASYHSPKDLKGMKFGVTSPGSASATGLGLLLSKGGLSLNDVSVIGIGGGARAVTAMKSGQLDGIAHFDPVISMLERDQTIVPIVDTRNEKDLDYLYDGPFAGSSFYFQSSFLKQYPNTAQAFANAVADALTWINHATTDQIVDAVPADYYGGDRKLYHTIIEKNRSRFSKDGVMTMAAAKNVLRIIEQTHKSIGNAKIDLAQTFDASFMQRAAQRKSK